LLSHILVGSGVHFAREGAVKNIMVNMLSV